jgi:DNA-directed RNA polymerase specialized sigma24 family protein
MLAHGLVSEPTTDAELLELWRRGDRAESVRLLWQWYGGRVRAALRRRFPSLRDEHVLSQAMNDAARTLLEIYRPEKGASLSGWFLFVAARRVCDTLRGERQRTLRSLPLTAGHYDDRHPTPAGAMASEEFRLQVQAALERLSPLERAVIEADIDAGKQAGAAQLARRLDSTEQSIYAARARARRKLQRWLAPVFTETTR